MIIHYFRTIVNTPQIFREKYMETHKIEITEKEINTLLQMIQFGQLEIMRQMKRLGASDYDIKEAYWHFRYNSNEIKEKLRKLRGF